MVRPFALLALLGCRACAACRPDVDPDVDTDSDPPQDTDTAADTDTDTGEPPPCDWPESEPQSPTDPDETRLEELACGHWSSAADLDFWYVDVPRPMWLTVRVDARSIGSLGDPAIALTGEDGSTARGSEYDDGDEDVQIRFPAVEGRWDILVSNEQPAGAEEGYHYELLVGQTKEPVAWDDDEVEPNDAWTSAQALGIGVRVYGSMDDGGDWFRVRVPAGKHTLRFGVEAFAYGSPGDFSLELLDGSGAYVASASAGEQGWEHDPVITYTSTGDEDLVVGIAEQQANAGTPYWYVLEVAEE
jgi:hypothetical protein